LIIALAAAGGGETADPDYPLRPVPFTAVRVNDVFWAPRIETNRAATVPYALRMIEETGRADNFRKAAGKTPGSFLGKRYNDSDVFKVMEGAAYTLMLKPDPALAETLDGLIAVIAAAQEPDGYLYTCRTIDPKNPAPGAGAERWSNLRVSHELYNVGHMYEAAVAHYQATGKRSFLDVALKNARLLASVFGPGKRRGFPGHPEIEIGLGKLYRVTGDRAWLDLAEFFLDERGRSFQGEKYAPDNPFSVYNSEEYLLNHKPVLEQEEAVGHAVRAMYLYAGMADASALGGRPDYVRAVDRLWADVVERKMYLTGGVGARAESEAFGAPYELPNRTAYAETCAAIGNALWQHRLFLRHGEAKYIDVLERVMYNGLLSGVGLDGLTFFYENPLESDGKTALYQGQVGRSPWFEVACCPPNILRFLPSVPGYVYAVGDDSLYVNLFMTNTAVVDLAGTNVGLAQETKYPWEGTVKLTVSPEKEADFALRIRVPGWARNEPVPGGLYHFLEESEEPPALTVNGEAAGLALENGYAVLRRTWRKGDAVALRLPMPVRRIAAKAEVAADAGRVAFQRGPLVYCAEAVDNGGHVLDLSIMDGARFSAEFRPDLLNGIVVLSRETLRGTMRLGAARVRDVLLVPYYAWANRGPGEMRVWFPRD